MAPVTIASHLKCSHIGLMFRAPRMVFAILTLSGATLPVVAQTTSHVVVVTTADVRGRVNAWDYASDRAAPWGLTRVATVVDSLRVAYPRRVLVLDAGNALHGGAASWYYLESGTPDPSPIIDALSGIGYDAVTLGDRDFAFGFDALARATANAPVPIVSGNINRRRGTYDTLLYQPYATFERSGVTVGVTGLTTSRVMDWTPGLGEHVSITPMRPAADASLRALEELGTDLKILMMPSAVDRRWDWLNDTLGVGTEDVARELAASTPKPDLVILGHTDGALRDSIIDGVRYVQPAAAAQSVTVVHIWIARDGERPRVSRMRVDQLAVGRAAPDPALARRLGQRHEDVRNWMAVPLASVEGSWGSQLAGPDRSSFVEFAHQVQRAATGAQLSTLVSFETPLYEGPLRRRDLFRLYPYDRTLTAVQIDGETLRDYLERALSLLPTYVADDSEPLTGDPPRVLDLVAGVDYVVDLARPVGSRVAQLSFEGRLVQPRDQFTLALDSYRRFGRGGYPSLAALRGLYHGERPIRDLLEEGLGRIQVLRAADYPTRSWRVIPPAAEAALDAGSRAGPSPVRDSVVLRVLATNDFHGALEPRRTPWSGGRDVGGAAALDAWMDSLAAECACASLRLNAGDAWQGTPISNFFHGRSVVEAFGALGIHAAAIGNHEFDWSVDTMRTRFAESGHAWLSANIRQEDGTTPSWSKEWELFQLAGLRVAVIGLTTTSTPVSTAPLNVAHLTFVDGAQAVRRVLPAVRAQQPDLVVVLAHAGAFCDPEGCRGEIVDVASGLDSASVDLIVSGHSHTEIQTVVNGIPIVQARSHGTNLAVVDFVRGPDGSRSVRARIETVWRDQVRPDSSVAQLVESYRGLTREIESRPVASMRFPATRRRGEEYALGRLVADALRNAARADIGIMNSGGIRADLPQGTVTFGQLYEVQPFGNEILKLEISGEVLLMALEHLLARGERGAMTAHVSGLEVWYDSTRVEGDRVRRARLQGDREVKRRETYTLAVPDFLAVGGDGFSMLKGLPTERTGVSDVDALIAYLRRLPQPVRAPPAPRFHPTK